MILFYSIADEYDDITVKILTKPNNTEELVELKKYAEQVGQIQSFS